MRLLLLSVIVVLAACGDAGESTNGQTTNNSSNSDPNVSSNVAPNNRPTNNTSTSNSGTSGQRCVYIEGDLIAQSDDDVIELLDADCVRIEGDLVLTGAVSNVDGIAVSEIGGDLRIRESQLSTAQFGQLETIGGSLIVERNPMLTELAGFPKLVEIGGNLVIAEGPVTEVTGFNSLRRVSGFLLSDLPFAYDFSGFSQLNTVRTFAVYDLPMLTSLDDFGRVVTAQTVQLYRNTALDSASGIGNSVVSRVEVALNPELAELPLTYDEAEPVAVLVSQNASLATLSLGGATHLRRFWVIGNESMTRVELPAVTETTESFRLEEQPTETLEMPQLADFDNFTLFALPVTDLGGLGLEYGGSLNLRELDELTNLDGLEGLDTVRGSLSISDNGSLTSILALEGMSRVGTLRVRNNANLSSCQVGTVASSIADLTTIDEDGNDTSTVCP